MSMTTSGIMRRAVEANGIHLHIAERGDGPVVVLCHGFPESRYSWRHQLAALSAAGFRAVAPDMRGYGQSDRPDAIDQYTLLHLVGDMVGLVDALGVDQAAIAGHDWRAPVAWHSALLRPDRFRAVIGLSMSHFGRGPLSFRPRRCRGATTLCSTNSISKRRVWCRRNCSASCARRLPSYCTPPPATCRIAPEPAAAATSAWCRMAAAFWRGC
jgi:pimeloyl-ACP methyl ester carboxylesterase